MKLIWNNNYTKYVIVLVLLLFIVYFLFFNKVIEKATNYTAKEDCGEFTVANRRISNDISNKNIKATLSGGVMTKVNDCVSLINEINRYLPLTINDIQIGNVKQSQSANTNPSISISVTPPSKSRSASVQTSGGSSPSPSPSPGGSSISTGSTISGITLPSQGATWILDIDLPAGFIGATGEQGPPGPQGPPGQDGKQGPTGNQGSPGKVSNSQYSSA